MSEGLDAMLASYSYDEETVFQTYKEGFLNRPAPSRDAELQAFDKWMDDNGKMSAPSRETAELLTRKRELLDIHVMLRKLGR
jgi:hypothetical protein